MGGLIPEASRHSRHPAVCGAVRTGDPICLYVPARHLALCLSDDEIARRLAAWSPPPPSYDRGYGRLYVEHVLQADEGCDFDLLRAQP